MVRRSSRKGQAAIEDIKTVAVALLALVVLGGIAAVLGIAGSTLNQGFAHVDGARLYASVAGLAGEQRAVTRIDMLNTYDRVQLEDGTVTFYAGFLEDGQLAVDLPGQYAYNAESLSGGGICIVKRGTEFTFAAHPCT